MFKRVVFGLLKFAFGISILLFILWLPAWYFAKPINNFCNNVSSKSTYEAVVLKAKKQNYRVFNNIKNNNGTIIVETQDMPMFRMGCIITFKDNKLINKEVIATD